MAELSMLLDFPKNFDFNLNKASLLHGVIMEIIDSSYADKMHANRINPFSMHLKKDNGKFVWIISTVNKEAYDNIIGKMLKSDFNSFYLKHNDVQIKVLDKTLKTNDKANLINNFYEEESGKYFTIHFVSPTSFKSNGKYIFYPELELLFKNIMNKYSACSDKETLKDEETLKQILKNTKVTKYNLQSVVFSLEGVKIPAFIGKIRIRVDGTETMQRFVRLLLEYSEYSGIGIKCSLGMGAVRLEKEEKNAG